MSQKISDATSQSPDTPFTLKIDELLARFSDRGWQTEFTQRSAE